jgi:hypothetical protein
VSEITTFQGFFSYTHFDAEIDPDLVDALTTRLARSVTANLTNARFEIWRDVNNLRTGQRWDDRIGDAVRSSHVFLVLMTPKWFESDYCRKEYQIFQQAGHEVGVGEYVVPLLARKIDVQIKNFNPAQKAVYDDLSERQYKKTIGKEYRGLKESERDKLIGAIADDIEGMIERLRGKPAPPDGICRTPAPRRPKRTPEFAARALNVSDVDYVSAAEIAIEPHKGDERRGVFAHLGFVERLYVATERGRVEFSVRLAYLSLDDAGKGKLARNPEWERFSTNGSVCYVNLKAEPMAITVCISPEQGRSGLSDLPLPPADKNENLWSMPATVAPDTGIGEIDARLRVSFRADDLFVAGEDSRKPSATLGRKIASIVSVLAEKGELAGKSALSLRSVPVRERK